MVTETRSSTPSACFSWPIPNPAHLIPWIQSLFTSDGYSAAALSQLQEKKIGVIHQYDTIKVEDLEPTLNDFIPKLYASFNRVKESSFIDQIKKCLGFFSGEQSVEFVTGTGGTTLINLLLNKNSTRADYALLETFILLTVPGTVAEKAQEGNLERIKGVWKRWFPSQSPYEIYSSFNDPIREFIDTAAAEHKLNKDQLVYFTKYINIEALIKIFHGDLGKCKEYLQKILNWVILQQASNTNGFSHLRELVAKIEPVFLSDHAIDQMVETVSPFLTQRFSKYLTCLFSESFSITDTAVALLSSHLGALSDAQAKAHRSLFDFSPGKLKALQRKIEDKIPLDPIESRIKQIVWGNRSGNLSQERLNFLNTTPEPLVLAYFRKDPRAYPLFQDDQSQLALECGELIFKIAENFLTEELLIEMFHALKSNPMVGLMVKNERDIESLRALFPFLKQILFRNIILQQMMGQTAEEGWYSQIVQFFSQEGMNYFLSEYALPSIKESFQEMLLEKVLLGNPALVTGENRIEAIYLASQAAYPNLTETYKESICDYLQKIDSFLEAAKPANRVQLKQALETLFENSYPGEYLEPYAQTAKQLLFDFGGLPWFIRWIFILFEELITRFFTSLLYPYRRSPESIAKIIQRKIQRRYSTPLQIDALVKSSGKKKNTKEQMEAQIDDLAKLIFSTYTHQSNVLQWGLCRITLGKEGGNLGNLFKHVVHKTLYQGSDITLSFVFKVLKILEERGNIQHSFLKRLSSSAEIERRFWQQFI